MKVWNQFTHMLHPDLAVFESNSTRVRAIVEASFDPLVVQQIIAIFPRITAEQLGYKDPVHVIGSLQTQDGPFRCHINTERDPFKMCLTLGNYTCKIA